jgi:hypothetical protein
MNLFLLIIAINFPLPQLYLIKEQHLLFKGQTMAIILKKNIPNVILDLLNKTEIEDFIKSRTYILIEEHPDGNTEAGTKQLAKICNDNEDMMNRFRTAYRELNKLFFTETLRKNKHASVTGETNVLYHLCDDLKLQLKLQSETKNLIEI